MTMCPASLEKLSHVHPDLRRVTLRAAEISSRPFQVTEGCRTRERQRKLVEAGVSRTLSSRHLTGHAIDFVPLVDGIPCWNWPPFRDVAQAFSQAARELGVSIIWGGNWRTFRDGPHIELDRRKYPEPRPEAEASP
jgi:hypothetical protein